MGWIYTVVINPGIKLLVLTLFSRVVMALKTKSVFLFYIFYEVSVIPITLIVFFFGYQPEKLQASYSLLLYTVVRSFPLFLFLIMHGDMPVIESAVITLPVT